MLHGRCDRVLSSHPVASRIVRGRKRSWRQHPAIRDLIGKNRYSFLIIVGLVAAQFALAWSLQSAPWWAVLGVAYLAGAFVDHALVRHDSRVRP